MKIKIFTLTILTCLFLVSCESENIEESSIQNNQGKSTYDKDTKIELNSDMPSHSLIRELDFDLNMVVEETPCPDTELGAAFGAEFDDIFNDPYAFGPFGLWAGLLLDVNFVHSMIDDGPQIFGNNGQYTDYVGNEVRNLEAFWNMPNEISVRGQHNETLNDKEAIVSSLTSVWFNPLPPGFPELVADLIIENNELSDVLPESPLFSSDGFAWDLDGFLGLDFKVIVIGDGLVELVSSVGTEDKIGWTTILSHEWAHHIQFKYDYIEYWEGQFDNIPEETRAIELEADFVASYYMTHKRGATYNIKRIEQYLENFFQIGDCGFTSDGHHGTPDQRMEASRLGDKLAQSGQKKGHILSAEEVHLAFVAALPGIVAVP